MKLLEAVREMEIGVLVIDSEKNILFMNPFFKNTFPMRETISGKKVTDIIRDSSLMEAIDKTLDLNFAPYFWLFEERCELLRLIAFSGSIFFMR